MKYLLIQGHILNQHCRIQPMVENEAVSVENTVIAAAAVAKDVTAAKVIAEAIAVIDLVLKATTDKCKYTMFDSGIPWNGNPHNPLYSL